MVEVKEFKRRANEIGTASNSAEKKGSPSEGVTEGGGWGEEFRHARSEVKRFRRLGIKTSKQNNFQFLLRKIWRAETRSEINRVFFVQKRFELRSVIATKSNVYIKLLKP